MSNTKNDPKLSHVLHIIQCLQPGGIESLVLTLIEKSDGQYFNVALTGQSKECLDRWQRAALLKEQLYFLCKKEGFSLRTIFQLRQLIKEHKFSVIHTHHIGPLIYATIACLGLNGITHIHTEHDAWHYHNKKHVWLTRLMAKINRNLKYVAISKSIASELKIHFPEQQIYQINNGIDTQRYQLGDKNARRVELNLPQKRHLILTAGRLEPIKGHKYLIQAMSLLSDDYLLLIAGDGSQKESLTLLSTNLGLANKVIFLGNIENLVPYYQASDVFCLPSINEGLPLALLEAQSSGLPVVVSDVGGCKEAMDPLSGLLVASKNYQQLADSIQKVMQTEYCPREFILKDYSLEALMKKYEQLYQGRSR